MHKNLYVQADSNVKNIKFDLRNKVSFMEITFKQRAVNIWLNQFI